MENQNQAYGQLSSTGSSRGHIGRARADRIELQTIKPGRSDGRLSTTQEQPDRVRSHQANPPQNASTNHRARFSNARSFDLAPSTTPPPTEWGQFFEARSARIRQEQEMEAASTQQGKYWQVLMEEYRGVPFLHQETETDRRQAEVMRLKTRSLMESRSNGGSGRRFRFWKW